MGEKFKKNLYISFSKHTKNAKRVTRLESSFLKNGRHCLTRSFRGHREKAKTFMMVYAGANS
jgi:hypothetical protein